MNSNNSVSNQDFNSTGRSYQLSTDFPRCAEMGWICPVCGRGCAPHVAYCPCNSYQNSPISYINQNVTTSATTTRIKSTTPPLGNTDKESCVYGLSRNKKQLN